HTTTKNAPTVVAGAVSLLIGGGVHWPALRVQLVDECLPERDDALQGVDAVLDGRVRVAGNGLASRHGPTKFALKRSRCIVRGALLCHYRPSCATAIALRIASSLVAPVATTSSCSYHPLPTGHDRKRVV